MLRVVSEACANPGADPYLPQEDIADFCREKGILIEAYSPLGSTGSPLFQEEGVQEVAKKHNVGAGTVLLSYQGPFIWRYAPTRTRMRTVHG